MLRGCGDLVCLFTTLRSGEYLGGCGEILSYVLPNRCQRYFALTILRL